MDDETARRVKVAARIELAALYDEVRRAELHVNATLTQLAAAEDWLRIVNDRCVALEAALLGVDFSAEGLAFAEPAEMNGGSGYGLVR